MVWLVRLFESSTICWHFLSKLPEYRHFPKSPTPNGAPNNGAQNGQKSIRTNFLIKQTVILIISMEAAEDRMAGIRDDFKANPIVGKAEDAGHLQIIWSNFRLHLKWSKSLTKVTLA